MRQICAYYFYENCFKFISPEKGLRDSSPVPESYFESCCSVSLRPLPFSWSSWVPAFSAHALGHSLCFTPTHLRAPTHGWHPRASTLCLCSFEPEKSSHWAWLCCCFWDPGEKLLEVSGVGGYFLHCTGTWTEGWGIWCVLDFMELCELSYGMILWPKSPTLILGKEQEDYYLFL